MRLKTLRALLWAGIIVTLGPAATAAAASSATASLPAYYAFTKTVTFTNHGQADALDVNAHVVLLPPATPYATVQLDSESRAPAETHYDAYGNLIGVFRWPVIRPGQTVTLTLKFQAVSYDVAYRLPSSYSPYDTKSRIYRFYTNPALEASDGVNTGAASIARLDQQVTAGMTSPAQRAQALFAWIVGNIHYNYSLHASGSAVTTLRTHLGICSDFADLYVAMLRTDGIPARLIGGYVTNNGGGTGGFHQWTEFYLPAIGWVVADPTWGRYGYFAALEDDWHIPLYDGIRSDISVHWQYSTANNGRPNLGIGYHYAFTAESAPPLKTAPRPLIAVKLPATAHLASPTNPWSLLLQRVERWVTHVETTMTRFLGLKLSALFPPSG